MHHGREPGDDAVREIGGGGRRDPGRGLGPGGGLHQRPSSSRSTSSSTAAAIAGFGARGTSRSPAAVISVTSLSALSKPMSAASHVVVDDEIDVLVAQHRALPLEPLGAVLGAERDEHLVGTPLLPERTGDVGRRGELELPGVAVLGPLAVDGPRGPVVRHRRGHHDHVRARPGERLALEIRRRRRLDDLDAVGGRRREIRGEQRDAGAAAAGLRRDRDSHPPRRAVADETDRVDRLARAPRRHDHVSAAECRRGTEQRLGARGDLGRLGHPAHPDLALGQVAARRADDLDAA